MAGSQIIDVDALMIEKQRLGYMALSLTHPDDDDEPQITAGSVIESGGSLYEFTGLESITGWSGIANSSAVYIKLTVSGTSITASFTITAPTWDTAKQGWYNGSDRYIGGLYKDADGNYIGKSVWPSNLNALPIGSIISFDGLGWGDNCTLPGWYACIAANAGHGCPDMVDKFIMGKTNDHAAGVSGGETAKTITDQRLTPHTHIQNKIDGGSGSYYGSSYVTNGTNYSASSIPTASAGTAQKLNISSGSYSAIFIRRCE